MNNSDYDPRSNAPLFAGRKNSVTLLDMKKILLLSLALAACASSPDQGKYREEKNAPKFGNTRSYVETPEEIMLSATAVLDELSRESEPAASGALKTTSESVQTGWVYSVSKDKYVEFKFNGTPRRKPLRIRRKYAYTVTPSLSGSQVQMNVEEEVMQIDLKTGVEKGWSGVETDPQAFEMMSRRLAEKNRSR